tara:strand:- start:121 stop:408 length:288 start_codon:yes stop_codon:yes gene_type:complete
MKKFKEIIIKHSFVSVYLVPLVILVLPFLFKFISEKSLLINPGIPLIQLGLASVWLIAGDIISKQHGRYIFGFIIYFVIYMFVLSFNLLIQHPPS